MISAHAFNKAHETINEAQRILQREMPKGHFVLVGVSEQSVFFNVVCKLHETNKEQMRDIKAKTRFMLMEETTQHIYKGQFSILIM